MTEKESRDDRRGKVRLTKKDNRYNKEGKLKDDCH